MKICHWAILHYNMSFKTIAGTPDGVFWWFPALSEVQENILSNSPKLSCGFNNWAFEVSKNSKSTRNVDQNVTVSQVTMMNVSILIFMTSFKMTSHVLTVGLLSIAAWYDLIILIWLNEWRRKNKLYLIFYKNLKVNIPLLSTFSKSYV